MTEEISRHINRGWTTRDIMVTAIISIGLGVLYIPITYFTAWLMSFPFALALVIGIYYWPIIMVSYLIRKPGTDLFAALVVFIMMVPLTPYGLQVVAMVLLIGLPIEIALLVGRYKFKLWSMMLAGGLSGLVNSVMPFITMGFGNLSPILRVVYFVEFTVCSALVGGLLAKWIGDAVINTGVITPEG